jgi:transcriptional regulator with XRE-family HTH domain
MVAHKTVLSHNIKFLRKKMGVSQEELANRLNIKRSNIAAYESKNVEPRLRIILELARIFNVDLNTLIETKLNPNSIYNSFENSDNLPHSLPANLDSEQQAEVKKFIDKSIKIRKILEGFKSFYSFRKKGVEINTPERERVIFDIENFIQLMDHLLNYNENLIQGLAEIATDKSTK